MDTRTEPAVTSRVTAKRAGDAVLRWSPFQLVFSRRPGIGPPVLAYHAVDDVESFETHLRYLLKRYRPVTLNQVIAAHHGATLPPRAVLVTFDDGDDSIFTSGLEVLTRFEVPAVAFVVTSLVGETQMLWTKEARILAELGGSIPDRAPMAPDETVRAMKAMQDDDRRSALLALRRSASSELPTASPRIGWPELRRIDHEGLLQIEDHSFSHPQLDRCSRDAVRDEIARSVEVFERRMGRRPRAFAYPDGAWSSEAAQMLRLEGYEAAFLFDHRRSQLPGGDRMAISRLRVNSTTSRDRFATIVSGLHPAIHRARGKS